MAKGSMANKGKYYGWTNRQTRRLYRYIDTDYELYTYDLLEPWQEHRQQKNGAQLKEWIEKFCKKTSWGYELPKKSWGPWNMPGAYWSFEEWEKINFDEVAEAFNSEFDAWHEESEKRKRRQKRRKTPMTLSEWQHEWRHSRRFKDSIARSKRRSLKRLDAEGKAKIKIREQSRKQGLNKDRCEWCGSRDDLQIHHLTYDTVRNVITLCRSCHLKQQKEALR
jgi:hypothetical protein